jgi:capsular polysaccharide biosynthesis protein
VSYRRTARRTRWIAGVLVVGLTLVGVLGGWALEHARGPRFTASTDVLVQFWDVQAFLLTGQGSTVSSQDVADAATLATSGNVLDLAAQQLADGRDAAALAATVTATPQSLANGITITATGTTASSAERASTAVAQALDDTIQARITNSAAGLEGANSGDFGSLVRQRAQALSSSVQPLQVLRTAAAQQTGPSMKTPAMLGIVGLAAGVLLVIALVYARPVVGGPRDAQRLTELPAVPFDLHSGAPSATRLVRRLLDGRPQGRVLIVPVDAATEKAAEAFAEWARDRTDSPEEAARLVAVPDPTGTVLDPRPAPGAVSAVVLVVPAGSSRRTVADAVALLRTWRAVDAVVVPE